MIYSTPRSTISHSQWSLLPRNFANCMEFSALQIIGVYISILPLLWCLPPIKLNSPLSHVTECLTQVFADLWHECKPLMDILGILWLTGPIIDSGYWIIIFPFFLFVYIFTMECNWMTGVIAGECSCRSNGLQLSFYNSKWTMEKLVAFSV